MFSTPQGKPGIVGNFTSQPREVFYSNRQFAQFWAPPVTIDGTASGNAANAPYTWLLWAGMPMGRVTATGKYANSILGLSTVAIAAAATTITTDVNTAAEIVRRIGAAGTFKFTGPPAASGTVATQVITYSAVNTTTGVITCTAASAAAVAGSFLQPTDGSETILTLLCETNGLQIIDQTHTQRVDVFCATLLAGGGTINTGMIVNYPTDPSLKTFLKSALRATSPSVTFLDDITG
ncbi:MAG: hypothetical protein M3O30_17045 [Planctomycetota bacterium]|nr:hypothetical protein [Planctomycetota bacterium]